MSAAPARARAASAGPGRGRLLVLCLVLAAVGAVPPAEAARDIAENRECATCHVMWLSEFKRTDVTPLIPYDPKPLEATGRQDVASTERMCFSCHDGFALDSRFAWRNKRHEHPVGVKPSAKVRIPTSGGKVVFPLNDDGKLYCGTCHTAHGVDWTQKESPVFMRAKNVDSSLCLACHLDKSTGPAEGNHPVFEHIDKFPSTLFRAGSKFGREGTVICQSCHRAHGAGYETMLVLTNQNAELCGTCHTDKHAIRQTKHDLSVMAPASRNRKGQTAVESGPCGVCHLPHNADGPALWARERIPGVDPVSARCLACHNPEGLAKKKLPGEHSHPVNVAISEVGVTATVKGWVSRFSELVGGVPLLPLTAMPLYDSRGLYTRSGGNVGCGTCHDPHVWSPSAPDQIAGPDVDPRKIEGGGQDSFLRIALDADSSLCANCHVDKAAVRFSKHNAALMPPLEAPPAAKASPKAVTKPAAAPPGGAGVCATCHQPHNAKGRYLWARGSAPAKGVIAGMCLECHREGERAGKKTIGAHSHPTLIPLQAGMRPELPLYDVRGQREASGARIECATCHDPHQWDPANLASRSGADAKADGDARTSFLRLSAGGPSALCVECHAAQRFVRGTDHDLAVTAPHAVNAKGETAASSGVCGQCHMVHNAQSELRLWARAPGSAPEKMESLCRSCHAEGEVAGTKLPREARHPAKVKLWSEEVRARFKPAAGAGFPVYDEHGKRDISGVITCTSCHNPHQWTARAPAEGPGRNVEGDTSSSFLRIAHSENFVCADCHGLDSLFRYKYFHGTTSRKKYPLYR